MADEHTGLGKLIEGDKGRDAVHIAIAPVEATEKLFPGQGIVLADGTGTRARASQPDSWDGIVDPFLTAPVFEGQRFWMWMRPGSITSLRHEWTHPAFVAAPSKTDAVSAAELRLRTIAPTLDMGFDEMIAGAKNYVEYEDYMTQGGRWEGFGIPKDFWENFEIYTGTKLPDDRHRGAFFSCSC